MHENKLKILICISICFLLANIAFSQTEAQDRQSIMNHIALADHFIHLHDSDNEAAHSDSARMIAERMKTDCYEKARAFRQYADL